MSLISHLQVEVGRLMTDESTTQLPTFQPLLPTSPPFSYRKHEQKQTFIHTYVTRSNVCSEIPAGSASPEIQMTDYNNIISYFYFERTLWSEAPVVRSPNAADGEAANCMRLLISLMETDKQSFFPPWWQGGNGPGTQQSPV